MDTLLRLLLRFLVVPLGVMAGMITTMLVVIVGYWDIGGLISGTNINHAVLLLDALSAAVFVLTALILMMWAIAAIGILFAETFAVRSWIFHVANGAVSAWLAAWLFPTYADQSAPPVDEATFYVVAAGLAGGLAYWLVAGWSAGFWKPLGGARVAPLPSPSPTSAPVSAAGPMAAPPAAPPPDPVPPPAASGPRPPARMP
ncbi:hypothetical protein [Ancylobacter amanitiformis]|uniref:DUF2569 domain-containing protein n=1 Tax=Ancylobacter amanitiformis TaxID=217069 RepID=A0ABU0LRU9_9HYPH|nr:hypothetical protein [Ancylobacter amanitiformis]MDQ0511419.1 hypothetical protein [Ancylobacter amanitiformis]